MSRALDGHALAAGVAACHDPLVAPARLIGRDEDVAALRDALVSARAGDPRCVLVTGEAGIGKTRLVAEALAEPVDALVVTGHGADMATGEIPFGVLADTLRDLVRQCGPDVLDPVERAALAPLLPGSVPAGHVERVQVLSAFVDLLQRLCSERLLVWVVEDLHWADTATRDLVNLAVRTIRGGLVVVATVRTDDHERTSEQEATLTSYVAGLARLPDTTVLSLSRLTPDEVRRQLRALLGSGPSAALASRIETLSDGVPFVVEELAAAAGRPELSTVSAVASGRLAGLSAEARRLVDAAAVGDGHLRISLVEQVLDSTPEELDAALVEATRAGILVSDVEADAVGFRHALLREATDRALGPGARRAWHRRWAEVLQDNPGVLAADPAALSIAEHWHHARDVRRSAEAAIAAMPSADRIADPRLEARLWSRVLRAWAALEDPEAVTGLTLREAVAEAVMSAQPAAMADFGSVLDAVPEHLMQDSDRAVLAVTRAITSEAKGDLDRRFRAMAVDLFDGFDLFTGPRDLFAVHALSFATRLPGDDERSAAGIDLAAEIAGELASPRGRMEVVTLRSHSRLFRGDPQGAAAYLETELAGLRDLPGDFVLFLDGNLMWCRTVCGEHREAQRVGEAALARLRHPELSLALWEHLVENHTFSLTCTGDWDRARQLLDGSAPWWEDDVRTSNVRRDLLDLAQRGTADVRRWRSLVEEPIPGGAHPVMVRHVVAAADAADGDLPAARAAYRALWADPTLMVGDDYLWCMLRDAARMEADDAVRNPGAPAGDAAAHMAEIGAAVERCRRYGGLGEVWPLDLAAQLDRFHGRDPRPALEAALAGWERIGHVPDTATTHLSLAEAHAAHGDREEARRAPGCRP